MTREELESMTYEELKKLCIEKDTNGHYTKDATAAYYEIQRRNNQQFWKGAKTCGIYSNDVDYYGGTDWSNR